MNAYKCDRCGKLYEEDKAKIRIKKFSEKDSWWFPVDLCPACEKRLKEWLECLSGADSEIGGCISTDVPYSGGTNFYIQCWRNQEDKIIMSTEATVEVLLKQIAVNPMKSEDEYFCPCCGYTLGRKHSNFCYNCGQCLDWTDE